VYARIAPSGWERKEKEVTFWMSSDFWQFIVGFGMFFLFFGVRVVGVRGGRANEVKRKVPVLEREATCCWFRDTAVVVIGLACSCRILFGCVGEERYRVPGEVVME
jgi:hypothetical protein